MASNSIREDIKNAVAAVAHARAVRSVHRRRSAKGSPQREGDIQLALTRLKDSMRPLRSYLGRLPYSTEGTSPDEITLVKDVSQAIQKERRKLWKMKKRPRV